MALGSLLPAPANIAGESFAATLPSIRGVDRAEAQALRANARQLATERCIAELLGSIAAPNYPLRKDSRGARIWPAGFVGSLSHKGTVVAGVIASESDIASIGIDIEMRDRKSMARLPKLVMPEIRPEDDEVEELTLVTFSAKESVYKAHYPLTGERIDFGDAIADWEERVTGNFYAGTCKVGSQSYAIKCQISGIWLASVATPIP